MDECSCGWKAARNISLCVYVSVCVSVCMLTGVCVAIHLFCSLCMLCTCLCAPPACVQLFCGTPYITYITHTRTQMHLFSLSGHPRSPTGLCSVKYSYFSAVPPNPDYKSSSRPHVRRIRPPEAARSE